MTDQTADDLAVRVLSLSGAMCGVCGDEPGDSRCADCERVRRGYIADLRAAGWAPRDEALPPVSRADVLTAAERTMLTYALDQAQERIWSEDGFTDEDQAAVDSLRRMAGKEQPAITPPPTLTEEGRLRAQVAVLQQDAERDRGLAKVGARCMRVGHQGLIETGRVTIEGHRFALSVKLGLGTGAPWDAIHARVAGLAPADEEQPATETRCTCADAGDCFAPAGHYRDCPKALWCPECDKDLSSYHTDDLVFRKDDTRPYCSGECVIAAHRSSTPPAVVAEQPAAADTDEDTVESLAHRVLGVAEVIDANGIGWAADSIRRAVAGEL